MKLLPKKPTRTDSESASTKYPASSIQWRLPDSWRVWLLGFVAASLAVGSFVRYRLQSSPVEIAVPGNLAQLEPQLRDYINSKLQWVSEKPRAAERHAVLGMVYAVNGLWAEAEKTFTNVVLLKPEEPLAHMYAGVAAVELGDPDSAVRQFANLTDRFPNFPQGYYRLGATLMRQGKVDEAEPAFRRLTELAPSEWRGFAGLGEVALRRDQAGEAARFLEQAVRIDPNAGPVHHLLGQAYRSLGRTNEAELELLLGRHAAAYPMPDAWSETASEHMKLLQDQTQLANEYAENGQPEKAVEVLANAFVYHPTDPNLLNQLAIALNQANRPKKARSLLFQVLNKDDRYVPALITLSFVQQQLEEYNQAIATAERAISLAPTMPQPHLAKANALLAMEKDEEALAALQRASELDSRNPEIQMQMGDVCWRNLNRLDQARHHYETALGLDPVLVPLHVRLADLHLHLRDAAQARRSVELLRRIAPTLPDLPVLEKRLTAPRSNEPGDAALRGVSSDVK